MSGEGYECRTQRRHHFSEPTFNYSGSGRPNSSDKSSKGELALSSAAKRGLATALLIAFGYWWYFPY